MNVKGLNAILVRTCLLLICLSFFVRVFGICFVTTHECSAIICDFSDLSMILCDPQSVQTIAMSLIKSLQNCIATESLPRVIV